MTKRATTTIILEMSPHTPNIALGYRFALVTTMHGY
jgi:hypothetical protein